MKVIITGASGFVASETIKQALLDSNVTSVVTLSRKPVPAPEGLPSSVSTSKLHNVVVDDYLEYSPAVVKELDGADACIWTISTLPPKPYPFAKNASDDEVRKVSVEYALNGLKTMFGVSRRPFHFVYVSGHAAERDRKAQPNAPGFMKEYCYIRGEAENRLLDFKSKNSDVAVSIPKPGLIQAANAGLKTTAQNLMTWMIGLPTVTVSEIAAALLAIATQGAGDGDTLRNEEIVKIGKQRLERRGKETESTAKA